MASEQAKEFRKQGIAAAKSGQKDQARQLLQQSLRLEPGSETAWLWLMSVARDQREKMICLYKLLTINPNNQMGLDALQSLGMTLEQLAQQLGSKAEAVPPAAAPASVAPPPARTAAQPPSPAVAQAPGVPVPEPQRLAQAQAELDALVREYLAPFAEYSGITWTRKTSKRAGERDSLTLRLYVAGGVTAVLVIVFIIGAVVIMNNPAARAVLFAPTETPTRTPAPPTPTFTPTLGLTPTPSPTPELTLTPSPTVNVNIAQNSGIEPTEIYPDVSERGIRESVGLINAGQVEVALPTLVAEVTLVQSNFNPNPYYYQAMGLVKQGELDRAAEVLRDAERRLPEKPNDNFAPLVNAGLAYVDALRAERALADRRLDEARALLANVEDRAQNAIDGDPRLEQPYLALARRYALDQDYTRAIGVIDEGLAVPELAANLNLILEKGEDYFQQGEFELATYQAFLALYVNPAAEPAHILQIRTALAQDKPGLAVLLAQGYLFYYPGSVQGYKLLGDARVQEENFDLALESYNQALAGGDNNPYAVDVLLSRATLYEQKRRYDLARDDLTRAFNLSDDLSIQARRMQAAYLAGNYRVAGDDAEALLGSGAISDAEIQLLQARILVDEAGDEDTAEFEQALNLLSAAASTLPDNLRPIGDEYRARTLYHLGNYDEAFKFITTAIAATETGSRHYLRGLILEGQGETEAAARDYDWVLTWSAVYPYSFTRDARQRLEAIQDAAKT